MHGRSVEAERTALMAVRAQLRLFFLEAEDSHQPMGLVTGTAVLLAQRRMREAELLADGLVTLRAVTPLLEAGSTLQLRVRIPGEHGERHEPPDGETHQARPAAGLLHQPGHVSMMAQSTPLMARHSGVLPEISIEAS
jgi:hypothetical protein